MARIEWIQIRATPEEKSRIEDSAREGGFRDVSEYVRNAILREKRLNIDGDKVTEYIDVLMQKRGMGRDQRIKFMVSAYEKALIKKGASEYGYGNVSDYLRDLTINKAKTREKIDRIYQRVEELINGKHHSSGMA